MKLLNIIGLVVLLSGALAVAGFGLYKFFEETEIPLIVKGGLSAIVLGIVIILFSLIRERLKEKNL